jgi:dihydrofolate reductase
MAKISMVVAYDEQYGIGVDNDLLFRLPADLKHFKDITMGGSIVMGRKTFESIGRVLPGRQNIIVSRSGFTAEGALVVDTLPAAYEAATDEVFVIGGGSIFEQALSDTDVIHATEVHAEFPNATVFFPELGPEWQEVSREVHKADEKNSYDYDFAIYERA